MRKQSASNCFKQSLRREKIGYKIIKLFIILIIISGVLSFFKYKLKHYNNPYITNCFKYMSYIIYDGENSNIIDKRLTLNFISDEKLLSVSYLGENEFAGNYKDPININDKNEKDIICSNEKDNNNSYDTENNIMDYNSKNDNKSDKAVFEDRLIDIKLNNEDTAVNQVMSSKLGEYQNFSFDDFVNTNYIVDPCTCVNEDIIDFDKFCNMDCSIKSNGTILIYHTHGDEAFINSDGTEHDNITGVGDYLAELLESKGYMVIHDKTYYDRKDGEVNRNVAYSQGLSGLNEMLEAHPEIDVIIDLHRDSGPKRSAVVDGVEMCQVMMFNGLSFDSNGEIEYLPNPNRSSNLGMSFQMKAVADYFYPGFMNKIYLKNYRFNLHLRAKSMLIETGTEENSIEEAYNAMPVLADVLDRILR